MAQQQMNKQLEDIQSSLNKKYEDNSNNAVEQIRSALINLNISELDLEKFKRAVSRMQRRHSHHYKPASPARHHSVSPHLQKTSPKLANQPNHHTHTNPQHRCNNNANNNNNSTASHSNGDHHSNSTGNLNEHNHNLHILHHLDASNNAADASDAYDTLEYEHHHHRHHRKGDGPILSILNACDFTECTEQAKWTWLYVITLICRYLAYFFIGLTIIAIAVIAAKIGYNDMEHHHHAHNDAQHAAHTLGTTSSSHDIDGGGTEPSFRAEELTGLSTLKLLTKSMSNKVWTYFHPQHAVKTDEDDHEEHTIEDEGIYFLDDTDIYNININGIDEQIPVDELIDNDLIIQSIDSATIFIKASDSDEIHFVPFRKPKDSSCSQKEYSFSMDCVNVHNVRDVTFHSKNKELEFLISGSYPRLIEITEQSTIILNDRVFSISDSGDSLKEVTNNEHYQDGDRFCANNIVFLRTANDVNRIIVSGSCYGLLYLPKSLFWNKNELQLLSSTWSSIIIDSKMYISSLIVASNNEASIIFRSKLTTHNLNLAITDNAYVEFKDIHDANYVSMITLKGSQIYIPSLVECKMMDFAARNHSMIEIANIVQANDVQLSLSHFGIMRMPHLKKTHLRYKREKDTILVLPAPHLQIENDQDLTNVLSFD